MTKLWRFWVLLAACGLGFLTVSAADAGDPAPPGELSVVQNFDSKRYLGTWYEIGSIPQWFQRGCTCTRATYSNGPNGEIQVLNECSRVKWGKRENTVANGRARLTESNTIGKLEVNFFLWFWGKYWIIELGPNYEYSVVSNPKRDTLWILSRTPEMDQTLLTAILERTKAKGIDVQSFQRTDQKTCK